MTGMAALPTFLPPDHIVQITACQAAHGGPLLCALAQDGRVYTYQCVDGWRELPALPARESPPDVRDLRDTPDELRERAIVAVTDAIERPHAGRVGEALDAMARWLREELRQ